MECYQSYCWCVCWKTHSLLILFWNAPPGSQSRLLWHIQCRYWLPVDWYHGYQARKLHTEGNHIHMSLMQSRTFEFHFEFYLPVCSISWSVSALLIQSMLMSVTYGVQKKLKASRKLLYLGYSNVSVKTGQITIKEMHSCNFCTFELVRNLCIVGLAAWDNWKYLYVLSDFPNLSKFLTILF